MDWYAVHVRWGCEQATAQRLACVWGVTTYCPLVRRQAGENAGGPLFPGYLLVQDPCCAATLAAIDQTPGCGALVRRSPAAGCRCAPLATLPGAAVEWLRGRLAADDGAAGPAPLPGLEAALGPLLSPAGRVAALLKIMGCEGVEGDVEKDGDGEDTEAVVKRLRRTRGHGRKIHYR